MGKIGCYGKFLTVEWVMVVADAQFNNAGIMHGQYVSQSEKRQGG
jgi:hypothetical protein